MSKDPLTVLLFFAALVVLYRTICAVSIIDVHSFDGHPIRFICLAAHWSLIGAGAFCALIAAYEFAAKLLIVAMAIRALSDRRKASP